MWLKNSLWAVHIWCQPKMEGSRLLHPLSAKVRNGSTPLPPLSEKIRNRLTPPPLVVRNQILKNNLFLKKIPFYATCDMWFVTCDTWFFFTKCQKGPRKCPKSHKKGPKNQVNWLKSAEKGKNAGFHMRTRRESRCVLYVGFSEIPNLTVDMSRPSYGFVKNCMWIFQ